jgi:hypothetical protein
MFLILSKKTVKRWSGIIENAYTIYIHVIITLDKAE